MSNPKWYLPIFTAVRDLASELNLFTDSSKPDSDEVKSVSYFSIPYGTKNVGVSSEITKDGKTSKIVKQHSQSFLDQKIRTITFTDLLLWLVSVADTDATEAIPCVVNALRRSHSRILQVDGKPEEVLVDGVDYLQMIADLAYSKLNTMIRLKKVNLESVTTMSARLAMSYAEAERLDTENRANIAENKANLARLVTLFSDTRETFLSMENGREVWSMFCDRNSDAREYQDALDVADAEEDEIAAEDARVAALDQEVVVS